MKRKILTVIASLIVMVAMLFPITTSIPIVKGDFTLPELDMSGLPQFFHSNITFNLQNADFSIKDGSNVITFQSDLCDIKSRAYLDDEGKTLIVKSLVLMENCKLESSYLNATFEHLSVNLDIYLSDEVAYYEVNKQVTLPLILTLVAR